MGQIRTRLLLTVVVGLAVVLGMAATVGLRHGSAAAATTHHCGAYDQAEANLTLPDARRFRRFDLYYAGRRIVHLPLTAVLCTMKPAADKPVVTKPPASYGLMPSWAFVYGTCTVSGREGGCGPPVEIQDNASCWDNLGLVSKHDRPRLRRLRGAPAAVSQSRDGGEVTLYTRRTTVIIDAPNLRQAIKIARGLRGVNAPSTAATALPAPSHATLDGKTKCRRTRPIR